MLLSLPPAYYHVTYPNKCCQYCTHRQVLPDSVLEVTLKLLHQLTAAAAGVEPTLEPFDAVAPADAAHCNVLEVIPGPAAPLPPRLAAAVAAANGALGFSLALHQPTTGQRAADAAPVAVVCSGGAMEGEALVWPKGVRTYLDPAAMAALRVGADCDTGKTADLPVQSVSISGISKRKLDNGASMHRKLNMICNATYTYAAA